MELPAEQRGKGTVEHKDQKHNGHGHERRSSLRLSDLHRIVENAVPQPAPEDCERKHAAKHGSHVHAEHEKSKKK